MLDRVRECLAYSGQKIAYIRLIDPRGLPKNGNCVTQARASGHAAGKNHSLNSSGAHAVSTFCVLVLASIVTPNRRYRNPHVLVSVTQAVGSDAGTATNTKAPSGAVSCAPTHPWHTRANPTPALRDNRSRRPSEGNGRAASNRKLKPAQPSRLTDLLPHLGAGAQVWDSQASFSSWPASPETWK